MSIEYKIISSGAASLESVLLSMNRVCQTQNIQLQVDKELRFWRIDSKFGRFSLKLEASGFYQDFYDLPFEHQCQVIVLAIEMNLRSKQIDQVGSCPPPANALWFIILILCFLKLVQFF